MKIGLMGLSLSNANKGVCALAYSCIYLLQKCARQKGIECTYYLFVPSEDRSGEELDKIRNILDDQSININICNTALKNLNKRRNAIRTISKCDVILDMSLGDSFADIYGTTRFIYYTYYKYIGIKKCNFFILGPQTYGPFRSKINQLIAKYIINNSSVILARDFLSAEYIKSICSKEVEVVTDVAFFLPYDKNKYSLINSTKKKVGLNVSMLLWSGGYNQNNDFSLLLDYKEFVCWLINYLTELDYEIHLIPHVVDGDNKSVDNDVLVCKELHTKYRNTILAPLFEDPISAKSYISNMDLFIGSRMHSTIGALSSGVPTIPVSYSRKFEGLFGTLQYNIGINGRSDSTEEAIAKMKCYINKMDVIEAKKNRALKLLDAKKTELMKDFINIFSD